MSCEKKSIRENDERIQVKPKRYNPCVFTIDYLHMYTCNESSRFYFVLNTSLHISHWLGGGPCVKWNYNCNSFSLFRCTDATVFVRIRLTLWTLLHPIYPDEKWREKVVRETLFVVQDATSGDKDGHSPPELQTRVSISRLRNIRICFDHRVLVRHRLRDA